MTQKILITSIFLILSTHGMVDVSCDTGGGTGVCCTYTDDGTVSETVCADSNGCPSHAPKSCPLKGEPGSDQRKKYCMCKGQQMCKEACDEYQFGGSQMGDARSDFKNDCEDFPGITENEKKHIRECGGDDTGECKRLIDDVCNYLYDKVYGI